MAKIIITFLLFAVQLQAQNTWVSGGGGDTTGIVHNAIRIRGDYVTLIPPTDNFILKWDAAAGSLLYEVDAGGLAVADFLDSLDNYNDDIIFTQGVSTIADNSVDGTDIALGSDAQGDVMYYNGTDWARLAAGAAGRVLSTNGGGSNPTWEVDATSASGSDSIFHTATIHDLDLDTLFFDPEGFAAGATNGVGTRVLQYKDGSDELFAIDSTGAIIVGTWSATSISDGNVDNNITVTSYLLLAAILDTLNNYDNDIIFTQGNASYAANSVSADELNATGVETELEAVMDLEDMQGAVTDGQVPDGITATNYLLLAAILDSLNNYDSDILFTQGITTIAANSIDSDSYIDGSIDNEHLVDNAVNSQELAAAAVTQAKFGFHVWEKTIAFPDTLKSNAQDTIWFARNHFGVTITIDSIYVESDVDNYDISVVKSDVGGHSPTLVDAIQAITNGSNHFYTTETTISSATVTASQRLGFVLTTDNANYVTIIISAAW